MTQKAFIKIQNGVLTFFGKKSDIVKKCIEGNTFSLHNLSRRLDKLCLKYNSVIISISCLNLFDNNVEKL